MESAVELSPTAFIQTFRRRSLLVAALKLAFVAALVNEGVRWLAVAARAWLDVPAPVLQTGPFFFVVAFATTCYRWSLPTTASRADHALDFRDRLTSLVDFSRRDDIPEPIVRAQAEEVAAALKKVLPARVRPVPFVLYGGPLLLLLSFSYPYLQSSGPVRFGVERYLADRVSFDRSGPRDTRTHGENHGSSLERPHRDSPVPAPPHQEEVSSKEKIAGPLPGLDSSQDKKERAQGKKAGPPKTDIDRSSPVESKRQGERLSKVVDPLYSAGSGNIDEPRELPDGSMVFSLLPKLTGGNRTASNISRTTDPGRVVVDFEEIPEEYRVIVERYYVLLAGAEEDGRPPLNGSPAATSTEGER